MNILKKGSAQLAVTLLAVALTAVSCVSTSKPWTVSITKTTPASIEVDLIGVSESERAFYENLAWDAYWPNTRVRMDADKLTKVLEKGKPWVIDIKDPIWARWLNRGATKLFILANLPDRSGLWKVALPLDKGSWKAKGDMLEIQVQDTMIRVLTAPKT
jgi:hypothetical protein